jgi:integrase/recombinase XerD
VSELCRNIFEPQIQAMPTASVFAFIDRYHPKQDGTCKVSVRVTYMRKKKYYPTGISVLPSEFDKATTAKRRTESDNMLFKRINSYLNKAIEAVGALPVFTFDKFEDIYLSNRDAADSVAYGFDKYIQELRDENRIGSAVSYECARASIERFKPGLKFADITPTLLRKYQNWMVHIGNSLTTVGIYMRCLRTIFNRSNIDRALYPFGEKNGKYSIPSGRNIKKALSLEEISKIYHHKPKPESMEEMARDYWLFMYLCNGMNVKDFCLLKRKNIEADILTFKREKTKRSKKEQMPTVVSIKPEAKAIITKWGQPSLNNEAFVFPHLQKGMTAECERQVVQQLTKTINKYMKRIATEIGINKPVTTYFARHSFATVLKNQGVSMEFISEALAHSSQQTTRSYLAGFEQETIHRTTDALLNFSK